MYKKIIKNTLIVTALLGASSYSFASLEECYKAGLDLDNDKIFEYCREHAKKDLEATSILASAYVLSKQYPEGLDYSLWSTNKFEKEGVPKDKHGKEGYTSLLVGVGDLYYFGRKGIPADPKKGLEYYTKSANLGNAIAQSQLGSFYNSNGGMPDPDVATSYKWQAIAAANGSQEAKSSRFLNGIDSSVAKEAPYCVAMGKQLIAQAYVDGADGLSKDDSKAKDYLTNIVV